jgi:hypothetical protein
MSALALLALQALPNPAAAKPARCHHGDCVRHGDPRQAYGAVRQDVQPFAAPRSADPYTWARPEYVPGQDYTNMYGH